MRDFLAVPEGVSISFWRRGYVFDIPLEVALRERFDEEERLNFLDP